MTPVPPRRWFRYSLRTMFVVITLGTVAVFGWHQHTLQAVQQRKQLLGWVEDHGGWHLVWQNHTAGTPWIRFPYGDQAVVVIVVPGVWRNEPQVSAIRTAFPESKIKSD